MAASPSKVTDLVEGEVGGRGCRLGDWTKFMGDEGIDCAVLEHCEYDTVHYQRHIFVDV